MDNDDFNDNEDTGLDVIESKSGRRRHRHHRLSIKHRIISPLWIAIILEGLIIASLSIWGILQQEENEVHYAKEKALAQTVNDGKTELEGLKWEFNEYKNQQGQTCLPNLLPLKFDEVMNINKDYVRSAMFVLSGKKDRQILEYKFVLKNNKPVNITPLFEIVFFNALGNQIGTSKIGYNSRGLPSGEVLEKGEVRSFDGVFDLVNGAHADFVMLKFKDEKDQNDDRLKPKELKDEPLNFNEDSKLQ